MKIGVAKERRPNEKRCAVSPDTIKKFVGLGADVLVEAGAGEGCSIPDSVYQAAGAKIMPDARAALSDAGTRLDLVTVRWFVVMNAVTPPLS